MKALRICVLGGTGFVGSHLVFRLADLGHSVTVPTRRPARHREFRVHPGVQLVETNPCNVDAMTALLDGTDIVINLVGILNESGNSRFQTAHVELPGTVVKAMREAGVSRLLHMSALNANVNESHSRYLKTKGAGEDLVHQTPGIDTTSFRPSVIFGPGDSFFNRFASLLEMSPLAFPLACAKARFAPVYVGNVVDAFITALHNDSTVGKRLDLCGPGEYSLGDLVRYTAHLTGHNTWVIELPDSLSRLQAMMLGLLPGKPFSLDNYYSLQIDSLCRDNALPELGIALQSIESIVPTYLGEASMRARYFHFRASARRKG
ncbi:NAD-dependent epimerase/dehydratase [hydrothermal vent metagenome]|uniref:NAD-dependent epimerase/dehydratase n=1 Tax=hydrothermal vent metagenome TaxID=652676 RepID=A0A3B0YHW1_9ZZZZ